MAFATEETITDLAVERWGTAHSPRMAELMTSLVKHLHAFARETQLTHEEWLTGLQFLTRVGQISDEKRQEFILLSDVLGLSMLVVMMNGRVPTGATPNTVLGPFHIDGSTEQAMGADVAAGIGGTPLYVSGRVLDLDGAPVAGAVIDFWQADDEGLYESQIKDCGERLRAIFRTGADGRYALKTVAPKGYAIPMDGPVGELIHSTDISYFRPAHIHFLITAPGHQTVITHLFQKGAPYIESDVVFGTVGELVVPFVRHEPGPTPDGGRSEVPFYTVAYDFVLAPEKAATNPELAPELA